jgi:hypothetical protein
VETPGAAAEQRQGQGGAAAAAALRPALSLASTVLSWDFAKTAAHDTALSGFFRATQEVGEGGGGAAEVPFLKAPAGVSWAFPAYTRSTLTEIYLCHACSCHEILRMATPPGGHTGVAARAGRPRRRDRGGAARAGGRWVFLGAGARL